MLLASINVDPTPISKGWTFIWHTPTHCGFFVGHIIVELGKMQKVMQMGTIRVVWGARRSAVGRGGGYGSPSLHVGPRRRHSTQRVRPRGVRVWNDQVLQLPWQHLGVQSNVSSIKYRLYSTNIILLYILFYMWFTEI